MVWSDHATIRSILLLTYIQAVIVCHKNISDSICLSNTLSEIVGHSQMWWWNLVADHWKIPFSPNSDIFVLKLFLCIGATFLSYYGLLLI